MPDAPAPPRDPTHFLSAYDGVPPWDIGRPQPAVEGIASGVAGHVLDIGCGTGEHALLFASRGCDVLGIDFVPAAIARARQKAADRGIAARFEVGDALQLGGRQERFDHVIDSGLFHTFSDAQRLLYRQSLAQVMRPGGELHLACFSELTPGTDGPRRVTQAEIRDVFQGDWEVLDIQPTRFDVNWNDMRPAAWLARIRYAPRDGSA